MPSSPTVPAPEDELRRELQAALAECARLREENSRLGALLASHHPPMRGTSPPGREESGQRATIAAGVSSPVDTRLMLFRSLFRGREDVYAVRWESRDGRSGYSPACRREWNRAYCGKPRVKCAQCEYREFLPLADEALNHHLAGRHTVGIYPLLPDDTCWFLAVDFDKASWQGDVAACLLTCDELSVPAALERSRSGNGAHLWVFFQEALPSELARNLGCTILTHTMERRYELGLDSYDRFFPNQDTVPRGGLGNLIALPLQGGPARNGNTLFLDGSFRPYADQWGFLSAVRRMTADGAAAIVDKAGRRRGIIGLRTALAGQEEDDDPWTLPASRQEEEPFVGPLPAKVKLVHGNLIYIEKKGLPSALINRLVRLAAFPNPEFHRAQAMRLSTFGKPRVIACAEDFPHHIGLPRGCLEEVLALCEQSGITIESTDKRFPGRPIAVAFQGELHPWQEEAATGMLAHDTGILAAGTAFGKTVVAAWIIAARKVNTLVLVHRRHLLDQWKERLSEFLSCPQGTVGEIGGGKVRATEVVDIALIQSLNRKGQVKEMVAEYGQVIVDECHHLSAFTFEQVLKRVKARYVLGLTATPTRRDGHHPIVIMQCGPIRFRVRPGDLAQARPFQHLVRPRRTEFKLPPELMEAGIQDLYTALAQDTGRNDLIVADLLQAVREGRSPLVLTERKEHVECLAEKLAGLVRNVLVLRGGMGVRQRRAVAERLAAIPDCEDRVLIATGRYIGEGFDDARLDTLFLAMPVSWRGTLQQYAGRLHRLHGGKRIVIIHDYVDAHVPVLAGMYRKRLTGYRSIGYTLGRENMQEPG